jgi:transcriptional regulator with XRE-family HTH domain
MKLSDTLRKIKKDRGFTQQAQVGRLITANPDKPITQQRISNWMKGSDDAETLWAVFKKIVLDVDPDVLFDNPNQRLALFRKFMRERDKLPMDLQAEFREEIHAATQARYIKATTKHLPDDGTPKRAGTKRAKKRL